MTNAECHKRSRAGKTERKLRHIAILDFETDPFDAITREEIFPFVCELYSDCFGSVVIWDECFETFIAKVVAAIEALPDEYTIYAHNGGKFDFLFLVRHIRGMVKFKGRSIMSCRIGNHELRDSLHILPEKLAAWKKDHFDYSKMKRCNRKRYRQEILDYLHSDCVYLFDIVRSFVKEFGLKISIGQAAFSELKKSYKVSSVREPTDEFLRRYFFGGRVECIAGRGMFDSGTGDNGYKLYDVNSMYPFTMANFSHPVGNEYMWRRGNPDENTVFVDVECTNFGAFVSRGEGMDAGVFYGNGKFFTTIWEYNAARKFSLIDNVRVIGVVDCVERTNFSKFIVPMYTRRRHVKASMATLEAQDNHDTTEYEELKKQDLFLKYLLNNSYGKFAQNPRNFKEFYYTDAGCRPPDDWMEFLKGADDETMHKFSMPLERADCFEIWHKPSPGRRYNNVGTAASITGAARAILLEAKHGAVDPIYCDTDSLICRSLGPVHNVSATELGAWKLEQKFDRIIIAGKKQYVCEVSGLPDGHDRRLKVRCKGADLVTRPDKPDASPIEWERANAATWRKFVDLIDGQIIEAINKAPTITKTGHQYYMRRMIRATAPVLQRKGSDHAGKNVIRATQ